MRLKVREKKLGFRRCVLSFHSSFLRYSCSSIGRVYVSRSTDIRSADNRSADNRSAVGCIEVYLIQPLPFYTGA